MILQHELLLDAFLSHTQVNADPGSAAPSGPPLLLLGPPGSAGPLRTDG